MLSNKISVICFQIMVFSGPFSCVVWVLFLCTIYAGHSSSTSNVDLSDGEALTRHVNKNRVMRDLRKLASYSEKGAQPGMQRILFSEVDVESRKFLRGLFVEAGLEIREDPVGNMFGRWHGTVNNEGVVGSGSHYDAIPGSGMYDGTVGVIGALEAVRLLKEAGFRPRKSLEVVAFTSEEPTRFGIGCLGSRALVGKVTPQEMKELRDDEGASFEEARRKAGYTQELKSLELHAGYFSDFVELHIEQAPILESKDEDVGLVTGIAGPSSIRMEFRGPGGHAGSVLMDERSDAGLAGAELALYVDKVARESGSADMVGTTSLVTYPRAINSIPRVADVGIDLRDMDLKRRDEALNKIFDEARAIAQRRGVQLFRKRFSADDPAVCADRIVSESEKAAKELGLKARRMRSRAYHDSSLIAQKYPTAMIFIPCRNGVSHHPSEYTSPENIVNGIKVLSLTMARLAGMDPPAKSSSLSHEDL